MFKFDMLEYKKKLKCKFQLKIQSCKSPPGLDKNRNKKLQGPGARKPAEAGNPLKTIQRD